MSGKPQSRLDHRLADALRRPRMALPSDVPADVADRICRLAIAGASASELARAAGEFVYVDGFRRAWLRDFDFRELLRLARAGRIALEQLDSQIEPLALKQRRLVHLLTSATSIDDDGVAPIADDVHEPAAAAAMPESPVAAPIANPTTTPKRRIE